MMMMQEVEGLKEGNEGGREGGRGKKRVKSIVPRFSSCDAARALVGRLWMWLWRSGRTSWSRMRGWRREGRRAIEGGACADESAESGICCRRKRRRKGTKTQPSSIIASSSSSPLSSWCSSCIKFRTVLGTGQGSESCGGLVL